jgi:hypothetical protein
MADEPRLKLDGVEYPLVVPDEMTMGEQRAFEKIADAGVDKLALLQTEYRAGLLVAWMAVSIKRERQDTLITEIVERLDQLKPADLQAVWQTVGQSPPPTQPSSESSAASPTPIELGFDATTENDLAAGIRRATGVLSSVPDTASDLKTSTG